MHFAHKRVLQKHNCRIDEFIGPISIYGRKTQYSLTDQDAK